MAAGSAAPATNAQTAAEAAPPANAAPPADAAPPAEAASTTPLPSDKGLDSAKTTSLENGAFSLEVPVWKPETHGGNPTSLLARYEWGGKGERTVEATRLSPKGQDQRWRLTFPDQPKPDELARISLVYRFELSAQDHTTLQKSTESLIDALLQAVADPSISCARTGRTAPGSNSSTS